MTESECLNLMVAPAGPRPSKPYRGGVIQIRVTRACDKACFNCTQGSQLAGKTDFMTVEQFEQAVLSLKGYWGVIGTFGGNPAISPHFEGYCEILRRHVPREQRGLWCNHPLGKGKAMRETFDPAVSNLNVHLDPEALAEFRRDWPEARPFGLERDSRHSPPFVAMKDVLRRKCDCVDRIVREWNDAWLANDDRRIYDLEARAPVPCSKCGGSRSLYDEERAWELISNCDINQRWSAAVILFRGQLRAFFCEVAAAQASLHQDEPDYPDTGLLLEKDSQGFVGWQGGHSEHLMSWWKLPMLDFTGQVHKHCHECSVPLRGFGELAQVRDLTLLDMDGGVLQPAGKEQTSATHAAVYRPKRKGRAVEIVTTLEQLGIGRLTRTTDYLGNATR